MGDLGSTGSAVKVSTAFRVSSDEITTGSHIFSLSILILLFLTLVCPTIYTLSPSDLAIIFKRSGTGTSLSQN